MRLIDADSVMKILEELVKDYTENEDNVIFRSVVLAGIRKAETVIEESPTAEVVCSPGDAIRFRTKEDEEYARNRARRNQHHTENS